MGWDGFATLLVSLAVATASGGLTLLVCWAIVLKYARRPADQKSTADVILVLGSRLDRGEITREFRARLEGAARQPANRPIIILGGMPAYPGRTEAHAGHAWLIGQGLDPARIIREETSRNTLENLARARELMHGNEFRRATLVTSRHHLARTAILARGIGLIHDLSPVDYPALWHPAAFTRSLFEALMINWYYVGQALARMTRNKAMLTRIS